MTTKRPFTLAVPGSIEARTGGYFYDRRLVQGLGRRGRKTAVLELPGGFPEPSATAMSGALAALRDVPKESVMIIDGLALGALDHDGLRGVKAPFVALVHHPLAMESGLAPALRDHLHRTERENLRLARHVLVPSPHIRELLVAEYDVPADRITVARPGTDRPAPGGRQPDVPPLILSVGILHPRKGHDVLIRALAGIADLHWQAVIAGGIRDDAHVAELEALITAGGLGDRIRLVGELAEAPLQSLYRRASVFALATRYEGYGIVFDEALSHGLPIVSCRSGAVPGTVPDKAGILVPPDDAPAFAGALRSLLEDPARMDSMATAATRAGAALPGWDETARIADEVLQNVS